jgi:hypothetical protein
LLIKYKTSNQYGLINLEDVSRIYTKYNGNSYHLVCTVPSATSDNGYEEQYLGIEGLAYCQSVISSIYNVYKQYIITDAGNLLVPPKVFEINSNVYYITASSLTATPDWSTAKVLSDNRAYIHYNLYSSGKLLTENIDYTVTYPLFKGNNIAHTIIFHLTQSGQTYKRTFRCSFTSDS